MDMSSWTYNIDIVGGCNLQCPSCPAGNSKDLHHSKGVMSLDLFEKILQKIKIETPNIAHVGVYNWAEPMLHPRLPEIINVARKLDVPLSISTNFNTKLNLERIVVASPLSIRISVSGFTQNYYSRTHAKGNIEEVKENMKLLRQFIDKHQKKIEVHVAYHCYIDNIGEEYEGMKRFCEDLSFSFLPFLAGFMPLEKLVSYFEYGPQAEDEEIIKLLAVKPEEIRSVSLPYKHSNCELRSNRTAINCDGSVALCCGVYGDDLNISDNFLEISHSDLQRKKYAHNFCSICMKNGMHAASIYLGSNKWIPFAKKRVYPMVLPKELTRMHKLMHVRQVLNNTIGVSSVDKIVHFVRRFKFSN